MTTARVESVMTLDAKRHVEIVSSACASSGHVHAIMVVLQLPPSASRSTDVSLLCRNATCLSPRDNALTVCSRKVRLLLMCVASRSALPVTLVFFTRSDPARSTRFSLETTVRSSPSPTERLSRCTVNTQCDREEVLFNTWSATARLRSPAKKKRSASASSRHFFFVRCFTSISPSRSTTTRSESGTISSASRSYIPSL